MKTETGSNNNNTTVVNMDFDMYPSISGKQQDPVREVVMKYIDYFLPEWVCDSYLDVKDTAQSYQSFKIHSYIINLIQKNINKGGNWRIW